MADFKAGTAELDIAPGFSSFGSALLSGIVKPVKDAGDAATAELAKSFKAGFANVGTIAKAAYVGIGVAALAGLQGAVNATVELATETRTMSLQLGISAEEASGLNFALSKLGISTDKALTGFGIFEKNLVNGNKSLNTYDLTLTNADGSQKSFNQVLGEAADKFVSLKAGPEQAAFAMNVFGRSGKALIPLLQLGSAGIAELEAEASKLGLTLSGSDLIAARQYTIAQREMNDAMTGLQVSIGRTVIPLETTFFHALTDVIALLEKIPGPVKTGVLAFVGLTGVLVALQLAGKAIATAWAPLTGLFTANAAAAEADAAATATLAAAEADLEATTVVAGVAALGLGATLAGIGAALIPLTAAYIAYRLRALDPTNIAMTKAVAASGDVVTGVDGQKHAVNSAIGAWSKWHSTVAQGVLDSQHIAGATNDVADAMKREALETGSATLALLAHRNATEGLAGRLLGIASAAQAAADSQDTLAADEDAIAKLQKKGKQGTDDYAAAISQLHHDQLAAVESQLSLTQSVTSYASQLEGPVKDAYDNYIKVSQDSKSSTDDINAAYQSYQDALTAAAPAQAKAVKLIRELGEKAGLSKGDINALIDKVVGYTNKVKGIPKTATTKIIAQGIAQAIADAKTYVSWLNQIDGTYTPTVIFPGGGAHPFAAGGEITEPVIGVGLRTGERYTFAEEGPETVVPHGAGPGGRGGGGRSVGPITFVGARGTPAEFVRELDWYVKSGGLG